MEQAQPLLFNEDGRNEDGRNEDGAENNSGALESQDAQSGVVRGATSWDATVNLTKSFLGAASFELPWAVEAAGLWSGLISLILFAFAAAHTLKLLARCRRLSKQKNPSYSDLGREAFGPCGAGLVGFGVVTMSLGVCASYLVFVAGTLHRLFEEVWDLHELYPINATPQLVPMMLIAPIAIALAQIRNFKVLSWTSILGIALVLLTMIYALVYGFINEAARGQSLSDYPFLKYRTYPLFFGNAAFLFCIHTVAIPIEQSLQLKHDEDEDEDDTRAPEPYSRAVDRSVVFVSILNIAFATLCMPLYHNWSDGLPGGLRGVQGNIMDNLPLHDDLVIATKIVLCIVMVLTFAIFIQPIAELCEQLYEKKLSHKPGFLVSSTMRAGLCMFCVALGLAVPDFAMATALVGGISNTLVGLILPPLFYLRLAKINGHTLESHETILNCTIIFFGVMLMVVSTVVDIKEVIHMQSE